jgi:hypothetical protein
MVSSVGHKFVQKVIQDSIKTAAMKLEVNIEVLSMEEETDVLLGPEVTVDNNGERDNDEVENQYSQINLLTMIWPHIKRRPNGKGEN